MPLVGTNGAMFGQQRNDHEICSNDHYVPKPHNWDELLWLMEQPPRVASVLPGSDHVEYQAFKEAAAEVFDKNEVVRRILSLIVGRSIFYSSGGQPFLNLEDLTDSAIVKTSLDLYDGADPEEVDQKLLTKLDTFIKPLINKKTPVVPNFSVEFKDPASWLPVTERQDCHAGSICARAIHKLRSFAEEDRDMLYDYNAYTITAIYPMGLLSLYAHGPIKLNGSVEYGMTLIKGFPMHDSPETF